MIIIELSARQKKIVELVKSEGPISGAKLADHLLVTRAALRSDLAVLTMAGFLRARPRVGYTYAGESADFLSLKRLKLTLVGDVQALPAVVGAEKSVYDAIVTMFLEDVGTLIVLDQAGYLSGVVSRGDLLRHCLGDLDLQRVPVAVVMTRLANVVCAHTDDTVLQAAAKLLSYRVNSLPVVKPAATEGKLEVVGVISEQLITRLFVEIGEGRKGGF